MRFKPNSNTEGKGELLIVTPKAVNEKGSYWYLPYEKEPAEKTMEVIGSYDGASLRWEKEQELINKALDSLFEAYLRGESGYSSTKEEEHGED
jgi:hypothetical protein